MLVQRLHAPSLPLHLPLCWKSLVSHGVGGGDDLVVVLYVFVTRAHYWNVFGLFLLCSVCQDNIGHRLLQKHGWKLGQGLGKTMQGKKTLVSSLSLSLSILLSQMCTNAVSSPLGTPPLYLTFLQVLFCTCFVSFRLFPFYFLCFF